ncbi:F0F1 ATP synthase subunit B [Aureivirga sp. CE67]|uniref:F0F1 ATP synthase subunit B n=1 Tax=Aureivirga sp. CE67 TaxID=1788983 RepID=UPI0018C98C57|nr:F0F1 ATP synthase subunit B [Aureivirga sp. CE67]
MNLIAPESLVFWTTIIFVVFFFILKKVAWKPILTAVKDREDSINNALAAAEEARKEMANLKADNERILNEARAERDAMLKEAREMKDNMINEAKEQAQTEATKLLEQAQVAIQNEKNAAVAELKGQVAAISLQIAEKVVKSELSDDKKQLELVNSLVKDVTLN